MDDCSSPRPTGPPDLRRRAETWQRHHPVTHRRQAIAAVGDDIHNFYSPVRRHSHNDYLSPQDAEKNYATAQMWAA